MTGKKNILGILIAFLVAVSFVPISGETAFATGLQNAFHASGHVTGLSVASTQYNSVTIQWTAYSGAEGYEICRADKKKGKYKKIATVKGCSFKDKGNKKLGKKKYYKVRAYATVNSVKTYSGFSGILAAKPKVATPSSLSTSGGAGTKSLLWVSNEASPVFS